MGDPILQQRHPAPVSVGTDSDEILELRSLSRTSGQTKAVVSPNSAVKKEHLGAFIDAVYAISITMLALDIPVEIKSHDLETLQSLLTVFIQYCLSFAMLFGFWLQHRQIHHYLPLTRLSLWGTAALLLVTTLIPRATTLAYEHGAQSGTILQLNFSEVVDIAFIATILVTDMLMGQLVLRLTLPANPLHPDFKPIQRLRQSKAITTVGIVAVTAAILLIPAANRNLLWLVAILIVLQNDVASFIGKLSFFRRRRSSVELAPSRQGHSSPE